MKMKLKTKKTLVDCIFDDDDFDIIKDLSWHVSCGYVRSTNGMLFHRLILGVIDNPDIEVDHINRNRLDNRKANLRLCSHYENSKNVSKSKGTSSIYKGVYIDRRKTKEYIRSGIKINGKRKHIGYFKNEIDAAMAYDIEAKKLFGEFANTNFK